MLNKKSAFKPKAGIRRPAAKPGSQGNSRPSATELSSNNTPAPQDPSSSTPQPAPHPTPKSAPVEINSRLSAEDTPEDGRIPSQQQGQQIHPSVAESVQGTALISTSPANPPEGADGTPATVASKEIPVAEPTASQPEESPRQDGPTTPESDSSNTSAVDLKSANLSTEGETPASVTAAAAAITSTDRDASFPETRPATQTAGTTQTTAPVSTSDTLVSPTGNQAVASEEQLAKTAAEPTEPPTSDRSPSDPNATLDSGPNPSQVPKAKRGRKRSTAAGLDGDSSEQGPTATSKTKRQKRAAPLPGEEGYRARPAAPRATQNRKRSASATENGDAEEHTERNTRQAKRRPPRPQRETTPPDAENVEIDITQVKMADLAKDMHIGKKFSLHDELMERERAKRLRYNERRRRQQTGEDGEDTMTANGEARSGTPSSNPNASTRPTPAIGTNGTAAEAPVESSVRTPIGETYQIIDGEIVLDHRSLQVDRHARAREEAGELVEVEENDFTHHTTSATYLRRNLKPQQWTDEETDLFYQALQAFGTDFDTICRMFKGKTRKHIKLKFNREERVNPQRITAALVGQKTVSIDMEQYQRATGLEYETAEAIYAEQRKAEEEFEARQKALEDEKAEELRRKKEEVLAQLNSAVDGEGNKKGGRKGRRKKGPVVMGL
ncbi:uncharacterized protein P884DRAFT_253241 [Thermothelomyces heterothallicus CBS 202.75]|uniref:uncharacterized protein n=1 Tax=Thermothelomyces heterothallicus CBS 202.75 TaxID=1149848 RepID=UPI0037428CDA